MSDPSRLRRTLKTPTPIWLIWALNYLGLAFVVLYPLHHDWFLYVISLVIAAVIAFLTRKRRYRIVRVDQEGTGNAGA